MLLSFIWKFFFQLQHIILKPKCDWNPRKLRAELKSTEMPSIYTKITSLLMTVPTVGETSLAKASTTAVKIYLPLA